MFRAMNDVDFPVAQGARRASTPRPRPGLAPIKINMVVKRGINEAAIVPMARHFKRQRPHRALHRVHGRRRHQRLAHGRRGARRRDRARPIDAALPLEPADPNYRGEVAERWRYRDGSGEIGVIASVTQAFCRDCTRARLSTDGKLYTCLFATDGYDLRALLRERRRRRRDRQRDRRDLAAARRPLFGDPHRQHRAAAEGRDELHRRLTRRRHSMRQPAAPP